mmetsp:Transcript_45437/g.106185  ORF Transcript_45437/g.106185 Transcript_45437/m.106185 type:complete len:173 (+) Transcript_45437:50-568(+)
MAHEILLRPHEEAYIKEHRHELSRFHGMDLVFEARMRFLELPPEERAKLAPGWLEEDQPLWQEGAIPLSAVLDGSYVGTVPEEIFEPPLALPAPQEVPQPVAEEVPSEVEEVPRTPEPAGPMDEPELEPCSAGHEEPIQEGEEARAVVPDLGPMQDVRSILEGRAKTPPGPS